MLGRQRRKEIVVFETHATEGKGDTAAVKKLLASGTEVNERDSFSIYGLKGPRWS